MRRAITIIAEAGVNHNGDIALAHRLVDVAADAGVDYVKFQTFKARNLVTASALKADYQSRNTGNADESQLAMLQRLELSHADHYELIEHCRRRGIGFMSTAFDLESVAFLSRLNLDFWKVPSGEITNFPYLRAIGLTRQPVVMSSGMSDIGDVEAALGVLLRFGTPREKITLLHCNTQYPTPYADVNLLAMPELGRRFDVAFGYSDHTLGIEIPIAATVLGASVIEKHFTLSREMPGPDHKASLEPDELASMVKAIRNVSAG